jgi:hypothetical protein
MAIASVFASLPTSFPENLDDEWDANWLLVQFSATTQEGSWSAVDPFPITGDLGYLADWLEALAVDPSAEARLDFVEPTLWFTYTPDEGLRAHVELELSPPWAASRAVGDDPFWINLDNSPAMLRAAARSLREQAVAWWSPLEAGCRAGLRSHVSRMSAILDDL